MISQELLDRARDGDRVAFDELCVDCLEPELRRTLGSEGLGDRLDDVVQNALTRVWKDLPGFRDGPERLIPWVVRIGSNTAIDHFRYERHRVTAPLAPDDWKGMPGHGRTTSDPAKRGEARVAIAGYEATLSEADLVLWKSRWGDESERATVQEVARRLGIDPSTVSRRLKVLENDARQILRRHDSRPDSFLRENDA